MVICLGVEERSVVSSHVVTLQSALRVRYNILKK